MFSEALDELVEIKEGWEKVPAFHGLMAEVLVQKGKLDDAVGEFKKTLELADPSGLAYVCRSCQNKSTQWSARCPSCSQWCTYYLEWEALPERSASLAS
jgi:hypothetical protein